MQSRRLVEVMVVLTMSLDEAKCLRELMNGLTVSELGEVATTRASFAGDIATANEFIDHLYSEICDALETP